VVDGETVEGDAGTLPDAPADTDTSTWYDGLMESLSDADGARR
jgi:hypothetical protein